MRQTQILAMLVVALVTSSAGGQSWTELGDAPEGVPDHQDTVGIGPLTTIAGSLDGVIDHVDTYSIVVTDPLLFNVSISPAAGEILSNARMYMWTDPTFAEGGVLLMANDDSPVPGVSSLLTDPMTWPGSLVNNPSPVVDGGRYLLSVTYFPNDAIDGAANPLADFPVDLFALHGPDPTAGSFVGWENPGANVGNYLIDLQGVAYSLVPEPTSLGMILVAVLMPLSLLRRSKLRM